ncbi:MAG: fimbrillin family protein [Bacteroidales bacterium]|nr:fimbrillin family protein [Bacteroidales bacterium]
MNIKSITSLCIAAAICFLPQSCDKSDPAIALPGTSVSSAGMNLQVATNGIIPVRSEVGTPTRVFGDPEDGITMTEYVSEITDIMPETKGTVITTSNIINTNSPINGGSFLVNAYRAFSQSELMETGDKDTDDNDDDVYNNGTMSKTTKTVRDFSMLSSYNGSSWSWSGTQPHWRNKSVFSIWSMFPANSTALSPATLNPAMPQPDWTNTALDAIADVDRTGKTDAEIAAAEKARQEAIQAYLRSMTFDYTLPLYAPTTASTSIYKDLLFAYNEEMREFEVEDGKLKEDANGKHIIKNGKSESFDVKFYHALAAVKFELETTTNGADIHSVTLCYTDTDGNIVTTDGLATKGTCTASATGGDGSREVNFNWPSDNLTQKRPMHFVFNDGTYSTTNPDPRKVSSGYANTGDGVLFMIPQSATGLKVIVEFSKYGGTQYYTKVITAGLDIDWKAGYCYTYKFKIGNYHVPGEILVTLGHIEFKGLMNAGAAGEKIPSTPLNTEGVTKVGLVLNSYGLGVDDSSQKMAMYGMPNGVDTYSGVSTATILTKTNPSFDFNFADVSNNAVPNSDGKIFTFGTGSIETYYSAYYSFDVTGGKSKTPPEKNGPFYYVFKTENTTTFQINFKSSANNNSCGFGATPRCIIALEVTSDPNLPGDFNTINWAAI